MDILVAHNFYQQPGGEDQSTATEVALLRAHGHNVIQYYLHNDAIRAMRPLDAASRAIWSRSSFYELQQLIRSHRPQVAHFQNTFPLISPSAYYAARAEGIPVIQTLRNFRLICGNALLFRNGKVCEKCIRKPIPWPGIVHKRYRGSLAASGTVAAGNALWIPISR